MNIKITLLTLFISGAAIAAPTGEIKVTGQLKLPTCSINGDNSQLVYDYGLISSGLLISNDVYNLPSKIQNMTISCDGPTYLIFKVDDKQAGSEHIPAYEQRNLYFGLGHVNGTGKIGAFMVFNENPTLDGKSVYISSTKSANINMIDKAWYKDSTMGWTSKKQVGEAGTLSDLVAGRTFSVDLRVEALIAPKSLMAGTIPDEIELNGLAVMTFRFGL